LAGQRKPPSRPHRLPERKKQMGNEAIGAVSFIDLPIKSFDKNAL
jgi:hypothetical protein